MKYKTIIILTIFISMFISCSPKKMDNSKYQLYTWKELPKNIFFERKNIKEFTNENKEKHYYETVYITSENINWHQASSLAQDAGGYLVSITSKKENDFIHGLISDKAWQDIDFSQKLKENTSRTLTYGKENSFKKVSGFIIEYEFFLENN